MNRNMMGDFFELVRKSLEEKGYEADTKNVTKIFHYIDKEDIEYLCITCDMELNPRVAEIVNVATDRVTMMARSQMSYVKLQEIQKS